MRQVKNPHKTREAILARIAAGESLRSVCSSQGMPSASTVCGWARKHPEFRRRYMAARQGAAREQG